MEMNIYEMSIIPLVCWTLYRLVLARKITPFIMRGNIFGFNRYFNPGGAAFVEPTMTIYFIMWCVYSISSNHVWLPVSIILAILVSGSAFSLLLRTPLMAPHKTGWHGLKKNVSLGIQLESIIVLLVIILNIWLKI